MATTVYEWDTVRLVDGTIIEVSPLKIKYLREFMEIFDFVKTAKDDDEAVYWLSQCARVCMKQFYPSIQTLEDLEDNLDLPTVYQVLDVAAGIKVNSDKEESVKAQATEANTWEDLDLAKLESEVFLLGIWKDYNELEVSVSMPELVATLEAKREQDYQERKFLAAIQGVDLDAESGNADEGNAWEEMKARVFSGGQASNSKDIVALQGFEAQQAGFGIGLGLDYVDMR
jgi:hypothetical protein